MRYWHSIGVGLRPLKVATFSVLAKVHRSTRPRVAIIVDDEVLLVQNWGDSVYALPGGGAHRNEALHQAAHREVKEELGIDIPAEELEYIETIPLKQYDAPLFVWRTAARPSITPQKIEITSYGWYRLLDPPAVGKGTARLISRISSTSVN